MKCQEELNACLANRSNCDISVGYQFSKICAHPNSKILVVVNQDEESILFDVKDVFDNKNVPKVLPDEAKKELWIWRSKSKNLVDDTKLNLVRIIKKVPAPSGLIVAQLQPSFKGFFVFYSIIGMSKSIAFKVIDEISGEVLLDFTGLVESEIVLGSFLPLVMSDSILSMCLGILCNDYFIVKLCEVVPNFGFSKELERNAQQPYISCDSQLTFLRMILNLHLNIFTSNLKTLAQAKNVPSNGYAVESGVLEKKVIERIDDMFRVVVEYNLENNTEKYEVHQNMLVHCFHHAVFLLDSTYKVMKGKLESELFSSLLKNLLTLFDHVKHSDPLATEWDSWRNMSDVEVVQEAVIEGTVALAHLFLVTNREWAVENVQNKFKETSHSWVVELISMGDLEKAKLILTNLVSTNETEIAIFSL